MDLSQFSTAGAEKGADLILKNPMTGQNLIDEVSKEPVTITLLGSDSQEYQKLAHAQQTERLRRSQAKGRLKITAQELDQDALELLASMTTGWKHISLDGKNELAYNKPNARQLYTDHMWIREQADEFMNDRSNFLGN